MNRLPLTLVAQPRFKRIADLKGAKLGTSSLTEGTAIYTMEMLARHGLHYPGDYEFAVVGVHPARWKALQEGTIDAAVQPIPFDFMALDAGYSNLGNVGDYIPEVDDGFRRLYRLIADHREALLSMDGPLREFQNDVTRAVMGCRAMSSASSNRPLPF